jgi:DNA-binding FadR family transcriptional regulator
MSIEEDLLREGWPHGRLVGSQTAIRQRYGIGRWAFRETAKVLETRGSAKMRRGSQGGLWALEPGLDNFARQLAIFVTLSRGDGEMVREAIATVRKLELFQDGDPVAAFLSALLERVWAIFAGQNAKDNPSHLRRLMLTATAEVSLNALCYARQLAIRIMDDIVSAPESPPHCLGSEWELAARYGSNLEIVRQVSRILEGMELVEVRVGRNGGIYTREPQLTLSRAQLFCYLAARGATPRQASNCATRLRVIMARQGAARHHLILDALLPAIDRYAAWAAVRGPALDPLPLCPAVA